jgi:hypothetical protein
MQDAGRAVRDRIGQLAAERPGLMARLRLFGLLVLLTPLFAGLQYAIGEAVPRVEVRFVPQDVPIVVPVERIVERVVERVIYVPVPADAIPATATASPTPAPGPGGTATPTSGGPGGADRPVADRSGSAPVVRSAAAPVLAPDAAQAAPEP